MERGAGAPVRSVLVAYATTGGGTRSQAEQVAYALGSYGLATDVASVDAVRSIDGYTAVILGSPMRAGAWQPEAIAFLKRHRRGLVKRLLWLFQAADLTGEATIPKDVLALARKSGAIGVLTLTGRTGPVSDLTLAMGADNEDSVPKWAALIASAIEHRAAI